MSRACFFEAGSFNLELMKLKLIKILINTKAFKSNSVLEICLCRSQQSFKPIKSNV